MQARGFSGGETNTTLLTMAPDERDAAQYNLEHGRRQAWWRVGGRRLLHPHEELGASDRVH